MEYIHFKDISRKQLDLCLNSQMINYRSADQFEVIQPVGKGYVDFSSIRKTLDEYGYKGWITLDIHNAIEGGTAAAERVHSSLRYLQELGY